eukprot:2007151-Pyramimonas_sp.AAC.1
MITAALPAAMTRVPGRGGAQRDGVVSRPPCSAIPAEPCPSLRWCRATDAIHDAPARCRRARRCSRTVG